MKKISFCVVCMNRLYQLKQTFIQNILDSQDYEHLQFVLLDYNSQDGMEEWVRDHLSEYISSGRVVYYKTNEPQSFSHSHAKNLMFKLADGEIVCNINADHFTGKGFAHYINEAFSENENIVLTPIDYHNTKEGHEPPRDIMGRVCVQKKDFLRVGGFDERMVKYGFEDCDFVNRLELAGVKRVLIEDFSFLKFINHMDEERFTLSTDNLFRFYVRYCTPSISELIFLYKDFRFEKGTLVDSNTQDSENFRNAHERKTNKFTYKVKEGLWENGTWLRQPDNSIQLDFGKGTASSFICKDNMLIDEDSKLLFYEFSHEETIKGLLTFHLHYNNRYLMEKNLENKTIVVNDYYGRGVIYKNFSNEAFKVL